MNELLQLISDIVDLIARGVLSGLSIYVIYLLVNFLKKLMKEHLHF